MGQPKVHRFGGGTNLTEIQHNGTIKQYGSARFDWDSAKTSGFVLNTTATYAGDPTGTSGSANTAETIITRTLPANSLTQRGDRIRIRTWVYITGGALITITTALNGVTVANIAHTGAGAFDLTEAWSHYVDDTHFNLIEQETGSGLGALSAINVAGSDWDADQSITIAQSAAAASYATVYGIFVDVLPLGIY